MHPLTTRAARGGVLVVVGGFAGSYVARTLGRTGATIVNPTNYMLYTPLLPEAAAGSIEPRHVTVPIREMCPDAELVLGRHRPPHGRRRLGRGPPRDRLRGARDRARRGHTAPGGPGPAATTRFSSRTSRTRSFGERVDASRLRAFIDTAIAPYTTPRH